MGVTSNIPYDKILARLTDGNPETRKKLLGAIRDSIVKSI